MTLVKQGPHVTIRGPNGEITKKVTLLSEDKSSWRAALKRLTGNGKSLYEAMYNLAMGVPIVHRLSDGRVSEPVCPSPEVMFRAQQALIEMMHGKAVAQSEVSKAEEDERLRDSFKAMSEAELWAMLEKRRKEFSATAEPAVLPEPEAEEEDT